MRSAGPLLGLLVAVSLFPPIVFFFPIYELVRLTGMANTPPALILPYTSANLPFTVLVLTSFFRTVPLDIEEAAKVDGLGRVQTLLRIVLPLAAAALATTGILVFIACWNEFLLALTFMTRDSAKTVTAGIASLSGTTTYQLPWGPIAASVVVSTLPLILMVVLCQQRIIQGLTAGAAKG
ncbi:MAG: carbohydrate ABC transporter permease [Candidatus Latescibacterota bacterium]